MESLTELFAEGGVAMYPILLLGMLAVPGAAVLFLLSLFVKSTRALWVFAALLLGAGLLAIVLGVGGEALGLRNMMEAVEHVNPTDRETIMAAGHAEAAVCFVFGMLVGVWPLAAGAAAAAMAWASGPGVPTMRPKAAACVLALGVLVIGFGVLGRAESARQGNAAVAHVDPADRATIAAYSKGEAATRIEVGLGLGLPLLLVGAALLRSSSPRGAA